MRLREPYESWDKKRRRDLKVFQSFSIPMFWNILRGDFLVLFDELYHHNLDLHRLNYATVVVIPKKRRLGYLTLDQSVSSMKLSRLSQKYLPTD